MNPQQLKAMKMALEYIEAVPDDRYNAEHIDRDALIAAINEVLAEHAISEATRHKGEHMNWLPEHKCGLYLTHNEHKDVYESIEDFYDANDFILPEEWHKAVAEDSVWVLQWYPDTPIGFHRMAASTLEAIETKLKENT